MADWENENLRKQNFSLCLESLTNFIKKKISDADASLNHDTALSRSRMKQAQEYRRIKKKVLGGTKSANTSLSPTTLFKITLNNSKTPQ